MKGIKKGFVYSEDIKRILEGVNAFDFKYDATPSDQIIKIVRENFNQQINDVFKNQVAAVTEEEMLMVNRLIGGEYPHYNFG